MLKWTYPGSASLFNDMGSQFYAVFISHSREHDGNIVIHQAFERIHVEKKFCDIPQGILMIRGEYIILIGELVR
ncbi:U6 snRNA-associated Sm-like protein LSm1 [Paragonimus westermani]|uniref:U6 snRNA-associated Sm-like protein LSm1 n=1 Tax=Paragonimus westermani TaxID=34504 RepID=A0A5J4N4T9_9TREM|nr:U6 snRNA-associated Sm-like protein LSm1 [Paragonimus westermani]